MERLIFLDYVIEIEPLYSGFPLASRPAETGPGAYGTAPAMHSLRRCHARGGLN